MMISLALRCQMAFMLLDMKLAKGKVNQVIIKTKSWLEGKGLKLATKKKS